MATEKRKLTPQELSRIRSEAGKKGVERRKALGHNRGGRPKGASNKNPSGIEPSKSILIRESAYKTFVKCAGFSGHTLVDFMSLVAKGLRDKNPQLFELQDNLRV